MLYFIGGQLVDLDWQKIPPTLPWVSGTQAAFCCQSTPEKLRAQLPILINAMYFQKVRCGDGEIQQRLWLFSLTTETKEDGGGLK